MKKMLKTFADSLLSTEQMSKVKGGCGFVSCGVCTNPSDPVLGGPTVASCDTVHTPWGDIYCICNMGGPCGYLA